MVCDHLTLDATRRKKRLVRHCGNVPSSVGVLQYHPQYAVEVATGTLRLTSARPGIIPEQVKVNSRDRRIDGTATTSELRADMKRHVLARIPGHPPGQTVSCWARPREHSLLAMVPKV